MWAEVAPLPHWFAIGTKKLAAVEVAAEAEAEEVVVAAVAAVAEAAVATELTAVAVAAVLIYVQWILFGYSPLV